MTPKMSELYNSNLKSFYKAFTGNDSLPETVTKFSDIKLKDYFSSSNCKNGIYNKAVTGNPSNSLFFKYIENVRSMLDTINKYHNGLLKILDELFKYKIDDKTGEKIITINPNLTDQLLSSLTISTIETINNLYTSCEIYYTKGVKIYTEIANKQFLELSKAQLRIWIVYKWTRWKWIF